MGGLIQSLLMRVDELPCEGETVLGYDYEEPLDAGKAPNYAVAAARLGAPVVLLSLVGNDERGARWCDYLSREGIDTNWINTVDGRTDVGPALLPRSGIPAMVSVCDLSSRIDPSFVRDVQPAIEAASVVVCSLECSVSAVTEAFWIARERRIPTVLNAAPALPLPRDLTDLIDVLIVNEHEAATLAGKQDCPNTLATALVRELRVPTVIVTAGANGAHLATLEGVVTHFPGLRVPKVVDTSGAGDALVGAFAVRLRISDDLTAAVGFGIRVAGVTVMGKSTMPSYPSSAELAELWADLPVPAAGEASENVFDIGS